MSERSRLGSDREEAPAVLVCVGHSRSDMDWLLEEMKELALACRLRPIATLTTTRQKPDPAYYIGSGKLEELAALCREQPVRTAIFGHDLTAAQIRNLERALGVRVTDRVMLIIEIFASRAKSFEGKLQVEIARCRIDLSKLAGYWTHLERQRSARGALGGPGEKQIEIDRRLIQRRIAKLGKDLAKCMNQTRMQKRRRLKRGIPTVALVGYTNAGKSSLLNALTSRSDAVASSRMFETLDSLSRRAHLADGVDAVFTDTVGFLRELPHELIAAFRATLAETADADLLLHVVDASAVDAETRIAEVERTLEKGVDKSLLPRLLVWNKCDRAGLPAGVRRDPYGRIANVSVSATTGEGLGALKAALAETLSKIQRQPGAVCMQSNLLAT